MEAYRLDSHIPGMVWGIVQDGRLVHVKGAGVQDIDAKRQPHTIESRVLRIQERLNRPRHDEMSVMTPYDARTMHSEYEQLRVHLRQMPNYV